MGSRVLRFLHIWMSKLDIASAIGENSQQQRFRNKLAYYGKDKETFLFFAGILGYIYLNSLHRLSSCLFFDL